MGASAREPLPHKGGPTLATGEPGSPRHKIVESFNGRHRDERLNIKAYLAAIEWLEAGNDSEVPVQECEVRELRYAWSVLVRKRSV